MKIDQLSCLMAVKHYMNFTQAADSLYMTQSALSKQIRALENELGVQLFDRKHSVIRLTPACERIMPHVEAILVQYDRICLIAKAFKDTHQKLRIASFYEMAAYGIVDLIVNFEQGKMDFHVESRECDHKHMLDLLVTGQTDIVIGYREFWPKIHTYSCVPLRRDRLVLIAEHRHPLAQHDVVKLEEASQERFCFPQEDTSLFEFLKETCLAAGFAPIITQSDVRLGTIRYYIRAGMRMTLQPYVRAVNSFVGPEFRIVELQNAPVLTLSMLADTDRLSDIGKQFFEFAQAYFRDQAA